MRISQILFTWLTYVSCSRKYYSVSLATSPNVVIKKRKKNEKKQTNTDPVFHPICKYYQPDRFDDYFVTVKFAGSVNKM